MMKIHQMLKRLDALTRAINVKHLILSTALIFISVTSCADTIKIGWYTWSYTVNVGKATITGVSPKSGAITITSSVDSYPVTSIGDSAFSYCSGLTSVTIPDSVTSIGGGAFQYCSKLKSVVFMGDAPVVGMNVFTDLPSDCTIYVRKDSTGWGVEIPGTWNGIKIAYLDEGDSGDGSGTNDVVATRCEVMAVAVKPRWPWNGLVDIDYTLQVEPTNEMAVVTISGCDTVTKQVLTPRTLSGVSAEGEPVPSGTHRLTWDIGMDYPQFHSEAFTIDVTATAVTNSVQKNTVELQ